MRREIVPVAVTVDDDREFQSLKIGDGQAIPLPKSAPAPRRLAQELAAAAMAKTAEPQT